MGTVVKWLAAIGLCGVATLGWANHCLIESIPSDVHIYYLSAPTSDLEVKPPTHVLQVTYSPQGGKL